MKDASAEFIAKEEASQRQPAELYHIWIEGGAHWRYTSGDAGIDYEGEHYRPAPIARDEVSYNAQLDVSELTVRTHALTRPAMNFMATNPVEMLWIEVLRLFRDQDPYEAAVVFVGHIKGVSFRGGEAMCRCVALEFFLRQNVPRHRYGPACNNQLYDDFCGVNREDYDHVVTLESVSADGLTLASAGFDALADGYFQFGEVVWQSHRRMIVEHSGETVKLQYKIQDLAAGQIVTAYAGCDWKYATCSSRFSNTNNFFGMRYVPYKNPTLFL